MLIHYYRNTGQCSQYRSPRAFIRAVKRDSAEYFMLDTVRVAFHILQHLWKDNSRISVRIMDSVGCIGEAVLLRY